MFILHRIDYCSSSKKWSLFFSSFTQFILELNGVTSAEEDLVEVPKPVEEKRISSASGFHVASEHNGSSSSMPYRSLGSFLSADSKAYFDTLVRKILPNSQAREFHIHAHIDVVAK
ncbi:unnamed protein product [Vicia faba]|uniref:Uncharacterized protein n=1 Tax=Vicia faba TaxID=3906 RepID=A0AAV1A315_VICFA|nr:unnamed protein product [Vicia faba]